MLNRLLRRIQRPCLKKARRLAYYRNPNLNRGNSFKDSQRGEEPPYFSDRTKRIAAIWAGGSAVYILYSLDRVPVTNRLRICALPMWLEIQLGGMVVEQKEENTEVKQNLEQQVALLAEPLIAVAERNFLTKYQREGGRAFNWEVTVVERDDVNAYCAPGGKIVVFTGLIDFCVKAEISNQVDDAAGGIAAVLSHEISHAVARHSNERLSWYPIILFPMLAAFATLSSFLDPNSADVLFRLLRALLVYVVDLPQSRERELEADIIGSEILILAGYPAQVMPQILGLLKAAPVEWASSHPSAERRAQETAKFINQRLATSGNTNITIGNARRLEIANEAFKRDYRNRIPSKNIRW